jgi:hypothetical protein
VSDPQHRTEAIYQVAFIVDDLESAALSWGRRGAGPFYRFDDFRFSEMLYPRGAESPTLSILLGYSGDTMLELIRVQGDPLGLFDAVPAPSPAPHHLAMLVEDIDGYLERQGCREQLAMHGLFPTGTPIAMLDTRRELGLLTELVTLDDSVREMIATMRREAAEFDGERLVRSFQ